MPMLASTTISACNGRPPYQLSWPLLVVRSSLVTQIQAERTCTVPFPVLFYKYGERVRRQCKYAREAAEVLEQMMGQQGEEKSEKPKEQA